MRVELKRGSFTQKEENFVEHNKMKATIFKYDTGICAVKVYNNNGYITVLPFNGQMIWDAVFNNRSLKMKTSFDKPKKVDHFLETYGCYVMHCGVMSMGCPSPEDNHPHHGEIPYVDYDSAAIIAGQDEKGCFIAVTGTFEHNRAFGNHYEVKPMVKLYENSSVMEITMTVSNLSNNPMEMMYMCHINNRSTVGGRIVQTLPWTKENMSLRYSVPQYNEVDQSFLDLQKRISEDVRITETIDTDDVYDPEIVMFLNDPIVDEDGWSHFMFVHPDGSADYTTYKPEQLDRGVRWMVRDKNWESMGMVLPCTAEPEGYTREKEKGNIKIIPAKGTYTANIRAGYLYSDSVLEMEKRISQIVEK